MGRVRKSRISHTADVKWVVKVGLLQKEDTLNANVLRKDAPLCSKKSKNASVATGGGRGETGGEFRMTGRVLRTLQASARHLNFMKWEKLWKGFK